MEPATTRTVLITGANRGIGLETARQLARRGFQIVIAGRNREACDAAVQSLKSDHVSIEALVCDVSDSASIRAAADEFGRKRARLDVLINNAGVYIDRGVSIMAIPRDTLLATFQTNTFGALEMAQAFLPFLRRAGGACIINVSSGYGQLDGLSPDVPSYCLSKLALNGATPMLAAALQSDGIAVNSVCPGWVRTDMGGQEAPRSVEEGADGIVWLAAEAPQELSGRFFRDRAEIPW